MTHGWVGVIAMGLAQIGPVASAQSSSGTAIDRIPARGIRMPLSGVAVIRDARHWRTLWQRFQEFRWGYDGKITHATPPPVDFNRYMLVAVSLGDRSGCDNQYWWVQRIRTTADSIVVEVGEPVGPEITCAMMIQPLDVVRIPRTEKRVTFLPADSITKVPDAASWWDAPDWTAWSGMDEHRRGAFLMAWARDPATKVADVEQISRRGGSDWTIARVLLERPEVLESSAALIGLVHAPGDDGRTARHLLLTNFGGRLAKDTATTPAALRVLIDELAEDTVFAGPAQALLANEKVRREQQLLRELIIRTDKYPAVFRDACHVYLARWPAWERVPDSQGNLTSSWASSTPCPDLPPFPH